MTDWKQQTVNTYNESAKELAEYFRGIGSRTKDIELALKLANKSKNAAILEIGCGDGRDAKEIIKRTHNYIGFDISTELIKLAREHVPNANFEVADATTYLYGVKRFDVVFAFASLLHLNRAEVRQVLKNVHKALKPGGIFFISLKLAPVYVEKVKKDKFGSRIFYFYNPGIIKVLAGGNYEVADEDGGFITVGNTEWFEIALKKLGL